MAVTKYEEAGPFNIMGHSMGCYFAILYSTRNPGKVDQMMFISAAGLYGNPSDWSMTKFIKSGTTPMKRLYYLFGTMVWELRISPTYYFKIGGYYAAKFLQKGWSLRLAKRDEETKTKLLAFMF